MTGFRTAAMPHGPITWANGCDLRECGGAAGLGRYKKRVFLTTANRKTCAKQRNKPLPVAHRMGSPNLFLLIT